MRIELKLTLELWREKLESKGFKLSRIKIEYMESEFNNRMQISKELVTIAGSAKTNFIIWDRLYITREQ